MLKSSGSSIGMPREPGVSHAVAAEAHEHAARAHRLAAEQCARGNFLAAQEFARQASAQAHSAAALSANAQERTREMPGQDGRLAATPIPTARSLTPEAA